MTDPHCMTEVQSVCHEEVPAGCTSVSYDAWAATLKCCCLDPGCAWKVLSSAYSDICSCSVDDKGFCCAAAGKYMLAHAASAQGISAVENICGRQHTLNHLSVPAACFTHPEVSFVGLTEEAAREQAEKDGYKDKIAVTKTSFKANSKVCLCP